MPPLSRFSKTCLTVGVVNALAAPCATAATITVGNTGDGDVFGPCTLRDAIVTHNTSTNTGNCISVGSPSYTRIEFNLPNPSTINLLSEPLEITRSSLDIVGPGKDALTIDASAVNNSIAVNNAARIGIYNLTINAGAVIATNSNDFKLVSSTIQNNSTGGYGGGVFLNGSDSAYITDSEIINNRAYAGGGIAIVDSTVLMDSSTVTGNSTTGDGGDGGGIFFSIGSSVTGTKSFYIIDSTISNNTVTGTGAGFNFAVGGGIATQSYFDINAASLSIQRSTISNNAAQSGGGMKLGGTGDSSSFVDTTISGNTASFDGGGVSMGYAAKVNISRSTLSNNLASSVGGAISSGTSARIAMTNSTISTNTAVFGGSAIRHSDSTYAVSSVIDQSTIAGNAGSPALSFNGGGVNNQSTFTFEANNVISNNAQGNCSAGNNLSISFGTFNWLDDASCGTLNSGDPLLGELADNGGLTKTHAPMPGSGLIGAGLLSACSAAPVDGIDQRGQPRGTTSCFIGAVEGVIDPPDPTSFFVIPLANGKLVTIPL